MRNAPCESQWHTTATDNDPMYAVQLRMESGAPFKQFWCKGCRRQHMQHYYACIGRDILSVQRVQYRRVPNHV